MFKPIDEDEWADIAKFTPAEEVSTLRFRPTLVATMYGIVIGYGSYYLDGTGTFYHGALRVVELYQGEGVGKRLMEARIRLAKDFHCHAHYALVLTDKPAMAALCEKFGMLPTLRYDGTRTLYVGDLLGVGA